MPETTLQDTEARDVLGADGAVFEPLVHNSKNGVTGGVWRVSAGHRSAVLKVLTRSKEATGRWAASDEPWHWNHWRREAYVYESGLAQVWQRYGIRAPRLLACVERSDGDVALWLEDVAGGGGARPGRGGGARRRPAHSGGGARGG
ncbi:aminoglycoside phosphotransferase, partial [Streptomyces sp. NPDC054804]